MNRNFFKFAGALLLALTATNFAAAVPINGEIWFNSTGATVDTDSLATAKAYTAFDPVHVSGGLTSPTGDYAGLAGKLVAFNTFTFSPAPVSFELWSFDVGSTTYSFLATSVVIGPNPRSTSFLNIGGVGIASISGMEDTYGKWSITNTSVSGSVFTFGASTAVPDGGTTALLLGLALVGMALTRRSFRKA